MIHDTQERQEDSVTQNYDTSNPSQENVTADALGQQPLTTGAYLQSVRLKKDISLEQVHKQLNIKPRIITAIEQSYYDQLPDTTTVSALVKQYANFLSLNGNEMSKYYKNEMSGTDQKIDVTFPEKLPSSFKPFRKAITLSIILMVGYGIWNFLNGAEEILPNIQPPVSLSLNQDNTEVQGGGAEIPTILDKVELEIIPEITFEILKTPELTLVVSGGDSWVEIKDTQKNRVIFSSVLKNGETYKVPSDIKGLTLKAGNSAPLSILLNGEKLDVLPKDSRVLRNFSLDIEDLTQPSE